MATARRGTTPGGTATPAAEAVGNPPVTGRFVGGYWLRSLKAVPSTSTSRTLNLVFEINNEYGATIINNPQSKPKAAASTKMATARRGTTPGGTATPAAEAVGNPPVTGRFVGGYWLRSLKAVPSTSTSTSRTLRGCVPRASGPHIRQNRRAPLHPRT
ncbi:GL15347 [Drosophila persimilis]|uniref:GL15347 n=1 Tax=Drosophila persimilis TaxID=7234 RepID=B4HD45_DROPE|nr:GL15347 [Drosophila persimilis]